MQLIRHSTLRQVDSIVQRKNDLAYVKNNHLILPNNTQVGLPAACNVVGEVAADFNVYVYEEGIGHIYQLNKYNTLDLLHTKKIVSGRILSTTQFLLNNLNDSKNTVTYFKNGKQK